MVTIKAVLLEPEDESLLIYYKMSSVLVCSVYGPIGQCVNEDEPVCQRCFNVSRVVDYFDRGDYAAADALCKEWGVNIHTMLWSWGNDTFTREPLSPLNIAHFVNEVARKELAKRGIYPAKPSSRK